MLLLKLFCVFLFIVVVDGYRSKSFKRDDENAYCDRKYELIACQYEDFNRTMLVNDRRYWKEDIWKRYPLYLHKIICQCRIGAKYYGFKYFTISFYGQCAGIKKFGHNQLDNDGCINGKFKTCTKGDKDCAGRAWRDAVYLTDARVKADPAAEVQSHFPWKRDMAEEDGSWKKKGYLAPQQREYESYFPRQEKQEDEIYYPREVETDDERRLKLLRWMDVRKAKQEDEARLNLHRKSYGFGKARRDDVPHLNFFRRLYGSRQSKRDHERRFYDSRQSKGEVERSLNSFRRLYDSRQEK